MNQPLPPRGDRLSEQELLTALEESDGSPTAWVAILWTWLEPRIGELNSREEKLSAIRIRGIREPPERPDSEATLTMLKASSDLLGDAAKTLVLWERWICSQGGSGSIIGGPTPGVDGGSSFYLTRWSSWIPETLWSGTDRASDVPPAADYSPTVHILAPGLRLTPVSVDGISATFVQPETESGQRALTRAHSRFQGIKAGLPAPDTGDAQCLVIHLAPLRENQTDGFEPDYERNVFVYGEPAPEGAAMEQIRDNIETAIAIASDRNAEILLLPEFSVPGSCVSFLQERLAAAEHAPAFTVAGLRHIQADRPGPAGQDPLSNWVNEAVVLGDDGSEIFRHRKMTSFRFAYGEAELEEDTQLGRRLAIIPTPIGDLAVVTCLDAFGSTVERVRESPASLVLVPSLSPSVSPHEIALAEAVRWLWGAAFVCNRHPLTTGDGSWLDERIRSFWTAALLNRCMPANQITGKPVFEFALSEDRRPDIK